MTLLNAADDRGRVMILLMASKGMRVGALQDIELKHLKRWIIDDQGTHIYQITVYANSKKNRYFSFCTPECAKSIDNYMLLRKRYGENIKQDPDGNWLHAESFLFVSQFNKDGNHLITNPKRITQRTFSRYIVVLLEQTGLRERYRITETEAYLKNAQRQLNIKSEIGSHRNEIHPCHSFRIFAITQMQRSKVDKTIREMLVGHGTGLDSVYYKPQEEEILQEYLKAVDLLTINNENRLRIKIDDLNEKNDVNNYFITSKLVEKEKEIIS